MENTLTYMDQGSFLALRALGRQPFIQFVWIYDRAVDLDGLRRFQHNLGYGLLGRRIETSPLPFGRHRWVTHPGPSDLELGVADRSRAEVWEWADERMCQPIDPEWGPAWRLGAQPFSDGGGAVSLVASHSLADARALCIAITDAGSGNLRDLGYPPPGARSRRQGIVEDLRTTLRSVPDTGRAVAATARLARTARDDLASSVKASAPKVTPGGDHEVVPPTATVWLPLEEWDQRAETLGGTSNSLFAGLAARLGQRVGRVSEAGKVLLAWPVSDRADDDTRANALSSVTTTVDAGQVTTSLAAVREDMRAALNSMAGTAEELLAPLPLVQWTPKALARRLEMMAGKMGAPVGCSNFGDLDPSVNRPDGSDAHRIAVRSFEPKITSGILDRTGGYLFMTSGRLAGQIFVSVGAWVPGGPNTKERIRELLRQALADMGLTGAIE